MPDPYDTPAMRQFAAFKKQHPDCVLFFRMGDFYEMFGDDAKAMHKQFGLTLTTRQNGIPLAGVPYHQLDVYLAKAVAAGVRVAVVDQVQDPKDAVGPVARAVTQVVTPGTLTDPALLPEESTSALAAITNTGDGRASIAIAELSTGRFTVLDTTADALADELTRFSVKEVLFAQLADGGVPPNITELLESLGIHGSPRPAWQFRPDESLEAIRKQFGVATLEGFGLGDDDPTIPAIGAVIRYLTETQAVVDEAPTDPTIQMPRSTLAHLRPPRRVDTSGSCMLDATSLRALEVERTIRGGAIEGSLLGVFLGGNKAGRCRTPMGKRLLRDWLCRPLADVEKIAQRHAAVAAHVEDRTAARELGDELAKVHDASRISARVALGRAGPRDMVALGNSLGTLDALHVCIADTLAFSSHTSALVGVRERLAPLADKIRSTCVDEPAARITDAGIIRDGVDAQLDEARSQQRDAGAWLSEYQAALTAEHDLPSLKVGFNRVFGYYIELPAAQAQRAPDTFTRKQILKNAERYVTPELKKFEEKVLTAESRALERERAIFDSLVDAARLELEPIARFADTVAELDVLLAFADKAADRNWRRPEMVTDATLEIHAGRHPVLDELLEGRFVANDTQLGTPDQSASLALITGPNMSGKSTYIRQVALIALLAHAGSFVPADRATIGVADRIFTRVGADDALHRGQSTFMVEMTETAGILNAATGSSLVILDEIGRGTSTLDGLSLARAITEHLAAPSGPRTLFATHYHELTDLSDLLPGRVANLHVEVAEWNDQIIFQHRILPGPTDQSYGIHVARLAGVPKPVIERAAEIMKSLAAEHALNSTDAPTPPPDGQLGLFTEYLRHPVVDELRELKLDALSPLEAFDTLRKLREEAARDSQ